MVLNDKGLKHYQEELLADFTSYLARTRELKDPAAAFVESTRAFFGYNLRYQPLPGAEKVPYVCLRVPTGGGKTRIAGHAIKRVTEAFLGADHCLVLWLVPSDPIREQTLRALKTKGEMLHQDMRDLFGEVHVLDIDEALYLQPATLNTANTIIVCTMQAFKRDSSQGLRVYKQNDRLAPHFVNVSPTQKGEHSLVDVIRLRCPFIIVDEAHNQGTLLAVETLSRFNPACILELTATPDRANYPSNVLRSVSAATLQAEDMLKLPLELAVHPEWRVSLTEAIGRVRKLELEAEEERRLTGEVIRPVVMLIQAERKSPDKETFTPERVKRHLIEDFHIPEDTVVIATAAVDELTGRKLGDPDYPQFIITVDKLREGWDCPYAYVLFSFRNTTSVTAVEQVLGRILRMPHVSRKQHETLNRAYAYVVSSDLASTVRGLKDGLVQNGFERIEAKDMIQSRDVENVQGELFPPQQDLVVTLPTLGDEVFLPDETALTALPKALRDKIEISPETATIIVKNGINTAQVKKIAETFKRPEAAKVIRERLDLIIASRNVLPVREKTPAERGMAARVPLLVFKQLDIFDLFDESALLDADWEIGDFDPKLTEAEFSHDVEAMRRASLSISQLEKVKCDLYDHLDSQMAIFDHEDGWNVKDLIIWLDRNIAFPYSVREHKIAWINAAIEYLMEKRQFSLDELAYRKFRLRGAIERKMMAGLVKSKQLVFDSLFGDESRFDVRDEFAVEFKQGNYAYNTVYSGLIPLKRHFFPVIGDLKSEGEEFECAEFIANQLEGVEWWVRNTDRKPTSFWLQTASDRFYPDFIVKLKSGLILVVEYKGKHLSEWSESREKKRIGELWAKRSQGRCQFVWVEDRNWLEIRDAAA